MDAKAGTNDGGREGMGPEKEDIMRPGRGLGRRGCLKWSS